MVTPSAARPALYIRNAREARRRASPSLTERNAALSGDSGPGGLATACLFKYYSGLKKVSYLPGLRCAFAPLSMCAAALPTSWWNPGLDWPWEWRWDTYKHYHSQTISCVPFIRGIPYVYTSSLEVAKQILNVRPEVYKAPDSTGAILFLWGDNVVSADHDMYKRHRRVVGSAFSRAGYVLVAEETGRLYREMVESEGWLQADEIAVDSINHILSKFALGMISRCGFGLPFPWSSPTESSDEMSFEEALTIVTEKAVVRLAAPRWLYYLPIKQLQQVEKAYNTISNFMSTFIAAKQAELSSQTGGNDTRANQDLLTRLVAASQAEGKNGLSDRELFGNTFTFMFAGHETTAHTLSATLALLSVHQEEQDKAAAHIRKVLGDRQPTLEDVESGELDLVLACFEEAARMYPPGSIATRDTNQTISLALPEEDGGGHAVIHPGVRLIVDYIGLHYNPRLFADPWRYDPSRWYGAREADMTFFSIGPRACLGRKFAIVEALFLCLFLREWKVDPLFRQGEAVEKWKERFLHGGFVGLAFGLRDVPLRITRRGEACA
ncbi:cytochrome P450 [Gloeophyllum trabeum ATCC 11539]|uniref:Cytochrome P450 n=1 Tax=Gloeophyllum trabeum (strain ATCC 11539 / FP-39264 / Madison 617) TaxID=670483 RepID=S7PT89_GLOTA|nr:cytochrome P450 [Gloeophyllum trabeum ATCC 11539]EPQ50623.1 cytochrome P450 [Gloeophyllum trabeum ATCC 11539]